MDHDHEQSGGEDRNRPSPPTFSQRLTALAARCVIRLIGRTLRYRIHGAEHLEKARAASPSGRLTFAFWHGHQFPVAYHWRRQDMAVLTSLSRDGTLQTLILSGLGFHCVRGSSSRGAIRGLLGLIRAMKEGRGSLFGVDGPRGPYHVVKPGILFVAGKTGQVIIPTGIAVEKAKIFEEAWDRYILPRPFTKVVLLHGEGFEVPASITSESFDRMAEELGGILRRLTREAESLL
jgi:lysophospholipid acyltransferase (LPLAT)-like uncharacterized protein